ncbi:MAG: hypothetical protein KBG15_06715 [Kofleriaceae bacterium]|nr:hypothetical protein [Kofleriaceae bacterium]
MTWSVLVFFAGPTPLGLVVAGVAEIQAPTDAVHICDALGWPRCTQSVEQRTLTLRNEQYRTQLVVDGPVAVRTLLPAQLTRPPRGIDAGVLACVISDGTPTVLVLDLNVLLARLQFAAPPTLQAGAL